jgi:hypothetical protein
MQCAQSLAGLEAFLPRDLAQHITGILKSEGLTPKCQLKLRIFLIFLSDFPHLEDAMAPVLCQSISGLQHSG